MRPSWAILVGATVVVSGCVGISKPARVPGELLSGSGGNGWSQNMTQSEPKPESTGFGLAATQTLVYEDGGRSQGHPASLSLTTLKTLLAPSTTELRDRVREQVRNRASELGVALSPQEQEGSRSLGSGDSSLYFLFRGTVRAGSTLFTEDADVRILGEVWNCRRSGTSVVAIGLAQINSVTSIGGVPVPGEDDDTNWRELVSDPSGSIDDATGSRGLLFNVDC